MNKKCFAGDVLRSLEVVAERCFAIQKHSKNTKEKHLYWILVFDKVVGYRPATLLKNTSAQVGFFVIIFQNFS